MEIGTIFDNKFQADGRGPVLEKVHCAYNGATLRAIDFQNSDDEIQHLFFTGVQVFMFTPEEVINYKTISALWSENRKAGIICLGRSEWLESFAPQHLDNCDHYQIMFYDELLDVICEHIEVRDGSYRTE
jgi:hypothetical protein